MQLEYFRVINLHFSSNSDTEDDWNCKDKDVHHGPNPYMLGGFPGDW